MAAPQTFESLIAFDYLGRCDHIHPALGTFWPVVVVWHLVILPASRMPAQVHREM